MIRDTSRPMNRLSMSILCLSWLVSCAPTRERVLPAREAFAPLQIGDSRAEVNAKLGHYDEVGVMVSPSDIAPGGRATLADRVEVLFALIVTTASNPSPRAIRASDRKKE